MLGMSTAADYRRANLLLLLDKEGTLESIATRIGSSPIYLSQIRTQAVDVKTGRPRSMGPVLARRIEQAYKLPEGWMDRQHPVAGEPVKVYQVAQDLSQATRNAPSYVEWESAVPESLPETFLVTAPDDSMSPRIRTGQTVALDRTLTPRAGDGVLVTDRHGHWYLRLYRQRSAIAWEAHALNEAYQAMDAERDGLTPLAVVVGVHARWG